MDFLSLVREFGPIIVLWWLAWVAGPSVIKTLSGMSAERFQAQNTVMVFNAQNVSRLLDQADAERHRNQASEAAMESVLKDIRAQLNTLNTNVNMIIDRMFKGD